MQIKTLPLKAILTEGLEIAAGDYRAFRIISVSDATANIETKIAGPGVSSDWFPFAPSQRFHPTVRGEADMPALKSLKMRTDKDVEVTVAFDPWFEIVDEAAAPTGGSGFVPPGFTTVTFPGGVANVNTTVPPGTVTLAVRLDEFAGTKPKLQARWQSSSYTTDENRLIFYDEEGNGFYTADFSIRACYYLEINPATQRVSAGVLTFDQVDPANVDGSDFNLVPSFVERLNPCKSLTFGVFDMGITAGVTTTADFAAAGGYSAYCAGAKSIDAGIVGNPAVTANVFLSFNPRSGSVYDASNVQITHVTGALTNPLPGPGVVMLHASTDDSFGADNGQFGWGGPAAINQRWFASPWVNLDTKGSGGTPMAITDAWLTLRF